jgi:trypsin
MPAPELKPIRTRRRAAILVICAALAVVTAFAALPVGSSAASPSPRIVGGSHVPASAAPWQIALWDSSYVSPKPFCGGSLIRPQVVLTAAHCVFEGFALHPDKIYATAGATVFSDTSQGFDDHVVGVSVYPGNTTNDPRSGDAALLLLEKPVPAVYASTIMLAGPGEEPLWKPGKLATVSGFGAEADGAMVGSPDLKATQVPMDTDKHCTAVYGHNFLATTEVCAGFPQGGTDACQGDSGGALTVPARGGRGGRVRQVGIVSNGDGCAKPNTPGIYARVGAKPLQAFIQGTVNTSPDPGIVIGKNGVCGSGKAKSVQRCRCKHKPTKRKRHACIAKVDGRGRNRGRG